MVREHYEDHKSICIELFKFKYPIFINGSGYFGLGPRAASVIDAK